MRCVPAALPPKPAGRVVVIGAGKASARMAEAVEAAWGPCEGLVLTRDGYGRPTRGIEIVEAAHPVPDARGLDATARMLDLVDGLGDGDFVLALISGGGSALLVQPAGAITLAEKQAVNDALLASGAPIGAMNIVRKHLSRVKGGQLAAAAWPARTLALIISDVPGDDPALIASGPTVGDASTPADARAILARWHIAVPPSVDAVLDGPSGVLAPDAPRLARTENRVIAAPSQSLAAAAAVAEAEGCDVRLLGDALEGEARELAAAQARLARDIRAGMSPGDRPVLLLSGGECTVTRRGDGIGGPNAEFCLALAAGARRRPRHLGPRLRHRRRRRRRRGRRRDRRPRHPRPRPRRLASTRRRPSPGTTPTRFFAALGDQVVTGPTLTNVNDFRALLVLPG